MVKRVGSKSERPENRGSINDSADRENGIYSRIFITSPRSNRGVELQIKTNLLIYQASSELRPTRLTE